MKIEEAIDILATKGYKVDKKRNNGYRIKTPSGEEYSAKRIGIIEHAKEIVRFGC